LRIGELAERVGVTTKAVRYYERLGLLAPTRLANGYRSYNESHVGILREIRDLSGCGVPPSRAAPFVECLQAGHSHSDECPASLATYRDRIAELDRIIGALGERRADLAARLE
jgi:DNA-binding transcriptional MerR regulator